MVKYVLLRYHFTDYKCIRMHSSRRRGSSESATYHKLTDSIYFVNFSSIPIVSMLFPVEAKHSFCETMWAFFIALKLDGHWINATRTNRHCYITKTTVKNTLKYFQMLQVIRWRRKRGDDEEQKHILLMYVLICDLVLLGVLMPNCCLNHCWNDAGALA